MNRINHLAAALGAAALLATLLILAVAAQPVTHAASNTIKVPDDHLTIQAAIDAAGDGDEIWVRLGFYDGDLVIDKGITLLGGWNDGFSARSVPTQTSIIQANGTGRGISITTATSDTVVTIDGFTIKDGNATGLGGSPAPTSLAANSLHRSTTAEAEILRTAGRPTPAEHMTRLRTSLAAVVERGQYPGGAAAYQDAMTRAEQYFAQSETPLLQSSVAAELSQEGVDCGGSIYSWNASLHLRNSVIQGNVASLTGSGQGGGVCVGQSAPSGTHIVGNVFLSNIASTAFDTPGISSFFGNGGGLYVTHVPEAVIEDNLFKGNVGSNGSGGPSAITVGSGGGLYVYGSTNVMLRRNEFVGNRAAHGWHSFAGDGGGAFLHWAAGATVTENIFAENLAALNGMCAGGGMLVLLSDNVLIDSNEVTTNWACLVATDAADNSGGGIMIASSNEITVSDNLLLHNTTALAGPNIGTSAGGGLSVEDGSDARIMGNRFQGNVACRTGIGYGGGLSLWGVENGLVADNILLDNVGSLAGGRGGGGGLHLRVTKNGMVRNNHFQGNRGVVEGVGLGGGGVTISPDQFYRPSVNATLEANSFFDNQASADPTQPSLGGGACFARADGFTFTNNVVADNRGADGSALFLGQTRNTAVTNNTLIKNSGNSAVFVSPLNDPPIDLTNNIIVSHTVGISVDQGATATVRYTLWDDNDTDIGGSGVISHTHPVTGAPAFINPINNDYHLAVASAARDAGDPAGVPPAPDRDHDGVARPQGVAVDIGAYEWRGHYQYLPAVFE